MKQRSPCGIHAFRANAGHFAKAHRVYTAAAAVGPVDLDSVGGGRGILFEMSGPLRLWAVLPKHGVHRGPGCLVGMEQRRAQRYQASAETDRGPPSGACQAQNHGAMWVIDVPAESQVHKQVVRKRAEATR